RCVRDDPRRGLPGATLPGARDRGVEKPGVPAGPVDARFLRGDEGDVPGGRGEAAAGDAAFRGRRAGGDEEEGRRDPGVVEPARPSLSSVVASLVREVRVMKAAVCWVLAALLV